jgi:hypothetical protein
MKLKSQLAIYLLITSAMIPGNVYAGLFGPSNYDECVAEYIPKNITKRGVPIVIAACRMKFIENIQEDYANCIFKYVPEIESSQAVSYVQAACRMKYIENTGKDYAKCIFERGALPVRNTRWGT